MKNPNHEKELGQHMRPKLDWIRTGIYLVIIATAMVGCAHFLRGGEPPETVSVAAGEDPEAALRSHIEAKIAEAARAEQDPQPELVHARPFYYREFNVYPEGPGQYGLTIRETGSQTAPYEAEVRMPILRYATRMRRDRRDAEQDTNFLRSRGMKTLTYHFKHRNWVHRGSLFVAEQVEQRVDGEWVALREDVQRALTQEPDEGFFGRIWSSIFGR